MPAWNIVLVGKGMFGSVAAGVGGAEKRRAHGQRAQRAT
jgi:hypothetical protein